LVLIAQISSNLFNEEYRLSCRAFPYGDLYFETECSGSHVPAGQLRLGGNFPAQNRVPEVWRWKALVSTVLPSFTCTNTLWDS